jgi:hypothetical protein
LTLSASQQQSEPQRQNTAETKPTTVSAEFPALPSTSSSTTRPHPIMPPRNRQNGSTAAANETTKKPKRVVLRLVIINVKQLFHSICHAVCIDSINQHAHLTPQPFNSANPIPHQ